MQNRILILFVLTVATASVTNFPAAIVTADGLSTSNTALTEKVERTVGVLSAYNDVPIDFYGQLEDQSNNAVSKATVHFTVQVVNGYESTTKRGQTISDSNGYFYISDYRGQNLGIAVQKAGYVMAATNTLFWYSKLGGHPFVPDPRKPTIIKMWKLQGTEPLLKINQNFKLRYKEGPINFDLLTGKIVSSGGDIRIIVNRPPGIISGQKPQDWNIDFEVMGGGFIESSEAEAPLTYVAPENGYRPRGVFERNNGPDTIDKTLFIQSRDGQMYSKIHFLFGINGTPDGFMYITFNGVANTNSSRNWEATAPVNQEIR